MVHQLRTDGVPLHHHHGCIAFCVFQGLFLPPLSRIFHTTRSFIQLHPKDDTGAVLQSSNPLLTFIFLFLYASALIAFLFIISTFFNRSFMGVIIHIVLVMVIGITIAFLIVTYPCFNRHQAPIIIITML